MKCTGCGSQTTELHADAPLCALCRSRARIAELERELNDAHTALDAAGALRASEITGEDLDLVDRIRRLGGMSETNQWHPAQLLAAALK